MSTPYHKIQLPRNPLIKHFMAEMNESKSTPSELPEAGIDSETISTASEGRPESSTPKGLTLKKMLSRRPVDREKVDAHKAAMKERINLETQAAVDGNKSIRRSTFIEAGNEEAEDVVYVHDKPFKKLAKQAAVTAAVAVLILATVGFFMGLTGLRTPHISGDAISNEWSSLFGNGEPNQNWNELEKNP